MFSVDMKYTGFYGLSFLEITVALFAVSRCFFAVITAVFSLLFSEPQCRNPRVSTVAADLPAVFLTE